MDSIACRALQGLGGSGIYSIGLTIVYDMVPKTKYPLYGAIVSANFALASLVGPLMGGAINSGATWRWVFLLKYAILFLVQRRMNAELLLTGYSIPAGVLASAILTLALPRGFPAHNTVSRRGENAPRLLSKRFLGRIDFVGAFLLLAASIFLVTALQNEGTSFQWSSGISVAFLVVSGVSWIALGGWEWFISRRESSEETTLEPVFPWRFLKSRVYVFLLL